jgi:hypothetical protein
LQKTRNPSHDCASPFSAGVKKRLHFAVAGTQQGSSWKLYFRSSASKKYCGVGHVMSFELDMTLIECFRCSSVCMAGIPTAKTKADPMQSRKASPRIEFA